MGYKQAGPDDKRLVEEIAGRVNVVGGDKVLNSTATAVVKIGSGDLIGIYVNSTSSGNIKIYDNSAASGTVIINTTAPSVGWNAMPFHFSTGLTVSVTSGTIDYTVSYS